MPSLGADMEAGILMTWRVKAGDAVKRGDVIAEVETDKGLIDIEVFEDGIIEKLVAQPGAKLPVGAVLATIRGEGAPVSPPAGAQAPAAPAPAIAAATPAPFAPPQVHARASPLARRIAEELGVDLQTVQGTGPGGAIERIDVENAAAAKTAHPSPEPKPAAEPAPADFQVRMRRAIASAMARSNREIPHFYLATRIDMTAARRWLEQENLRRPIKQRLLPAALLLKSVALALQDIPELNAYWVDDALQLRPQIHIGFAIALRHGGLITPAIHDVNRLSLDDIQTALNDLIPRTRAGRLRSSELMDGTVTVTSLGDLGVESVQGVIYPPQVALVGFGRITEEPWAENGMLGVRPVLHATLAADHRASDGLRGAQFLDRLTHHLTHPECL